MNFYLCIADKGGRLPCIQDMNYYSPKQHLIRCKRFLDNEEIRGLLAKISRTRKGVHIIGTWNDGLKDDIGIPQIVKYENIK